MKKILFIMVGILFYNSNYGQGSFLNISTTYALPIFKYSIDGMINSSKGDNSYTYSDASISLGKGLNISTGYYHLINDNFGYQVMLSYFLGSKMSLSVQSDVGPIIKTIRDDYSCKFLSINPGFLFTFPLNIFRPYLSLGLSIGKGTITKNQNIESGTSVTKLQYEYRGGNYIGPYSGVGFDLKLSDNFTIFTEFIVCNIQYAPRKGELLEASENGNDVLDTYTISQKEIEFTESYTKDDFQLPDENQPSKEILKRYSCSSFSFGFGIRISLE